MHGEVLAAADLTAPTATLAAAWFTGDKRTAITDFEPSEDALVVVWDDSGAPDDQPEVQLLADPFNAGQLQLCVGTNVMALVSGAAPVTGADVRTMPLSTARVLGLPVQ